MRPLPALALLSVLAVAAGLFVTRQGTQAAEGTATLQIGGLDVGKGKTAIVRLHNATTSSYTVHYTIFALDTLNDAPVALSLPGAGDGAQLFGGDTLQLDVGAIVDAYRAQQEAGTWDAPVRFVAFGSGVGAQPFGPDTVIAEALQQVGSATYAAPVSWTGR